MSSEEVGVDGPFGGAAPFLTGVLGGKVLSMYSGLMYGPKLTLLPDPEGVKWAGMLLRAENRAVPARRGVADSEVACCNKDKSGT